MIRSDGRARIEQGDAVMLWPKAGKYNCKRDGAENSKFEYRSSKQIRVPYFGFWFSNSDIRARFEFRISNSFLHGRRIPPRKTTLMPIGIRELCRTGSIEFGDLLLAQVPADCAQIRTKLFFVARANNKG